MNSWVLIGLGNLGVRVRNGDVNLNKRLRKIVERTTIKS